MSILSITSDTKFDCINNFGKLDLEANLHEKHSIILTPHATHETDTIMVNTFLWSNHKVNMLLKHPTKKMVHHSKHIIPLTKLVIPNVTMFFAAFRRPHRFLKSWHLALPITVPPWKYNTSMPHRNILFCRLQLFDLLF